MSENFSFLKGEWFEIHEAATKAAQAVYPDPRTACFYARRALELAVMWAFKHDSSLRLPYQDTLSALIHEPTFKAAAGDAVFSKARVIIKLGNDAVHKPRAIPPSDALNAVQELFHVAYWFARSYARLAAPSASLAFDSQSLPRTAPIPNHTLAQLKSLQENLHSKDEKLSALLANSAARDAELERLRGEIAAIRAAADTRADTHDYSEEATRDILIDLLLKEAGWPLERPQDREFEVQGMPNSKGNGFVDYVLWGDDGRPLGLVEAKRTRRDPREGQRQAELYADCLEKQFGQRPVIFLSNGYEHWIWDNLSYPQRPVQGFYKKDELELLIQRRTSRKPLSRTTINPDIVARYYQTRAIRRIGEAFETDHERKALVVMATGAGKTRTVVALCDLLVRCNWAKRVLFLADRVALVNQAAKVFQKYLPDSAPVNLVTERNGEGRFFVSTYATMSGLIDSTRDEARRFGVGHFDLLVIDEAHRSVFQKYRAIFTYFDSLLVGLTATPKDEVDRSTYALFDLESGVPTDAYGLDEAVKDKFLVPPKAVSVPVGFVRSGIRYDDLSPEEQEQWDEVDWEDEDGPPTEIDSEAVNKWLFNKDTVDKVLEHLMTHGLKVAGGDRLGKTIIFAKNQAHADFIEERFNAHYPHLLGAFARVITFKSAYAQSLIDDFSKSARAPHIAISVDMLDTGIDVPEIVNLAFFKVVRSKTKFWQMVGRGTRLCEDLFGPGEHKQHFCIFDYCQNLEYFSQNLPPEVGTSTSSLSKRLFLRRLQLMQDLDRKQTTPPDACLPVLRENSVVPFGDPQTGEHVRASVAAGLQREVAAMNLDNFIVRPQRRVIEKYLELQAWKNLDDQNYIELAHGVAGLPSELAAEAEEIKRFDLLMLNLELALLRSAKSFGRLSDEVKKIASLLEEKSTIPMVREALPVLEEIQGDQWWQGVTVPMLERVRLRLRLLVTLIEKGSRPPIFTDFEDELGPEEVIELPIIVAAAEFEKFRAKARRFLLEHQDHLTIRKLKTNKPLTISDLTELERMLLESGIGGPRDIERAKSEAEGLGLFVRSLIGLDREAAKAALADFLNDKTLSASQIEFVNLIVDQLTEKGAVSTSALYESPFTDITAKGPEMLFTTAQVDALVAAVQQVREMATAAG